MKVILRFVLALLFCVQLSGCSSSKKIAAMRPEPDDATPLLYDVDPSFINLPVTIKLSDIESQTNKFLTGLIYEDNKIEDDDIALKIWKQAPIEITTESGKIKTILPLKVWVKYRIGTGKFGVDLFTDREFNLNGRITLLSSFGLSNWKMNTTTEFKELKWQESPTTTVLGKQVPITYAINPAIHFFKAKIEKSIDEAISKSMDFKPNVLDALEKVSQPFQMSETYDTWLRIVPVELYASDAKLVKDQIAMQMGLKCTMETFVGKKPEVKFNRDRIVLKPVSKMPDRISANIAAVSSFADASRIMSANFAGQEFGSGSNKVKVTKVALWHKSGKMVIALDMLGSLNGTVYLTGLPKYDEKTYEIYFDELDYALDTKSKLMRTANWLAGSLVLRKIQESCRYSIKPNLDEGKRNLLGYLKNYSPMPGVYVNGTAGDINFKKVELTNQAIIAFLNLEGKVSVTVDGIK